MARLLVLADAKDVERMGALLSTHGHLLTFASSPAEAVEKAKQRPPELLIVDLELVSPGWLEKVKQGRKFPVLALVAREKLEALPPGVDEFVLSPWAEGELLLRLERRLGPALSPDVLRFGDLSMDLVRYEVTVAGKRVELTFKEYQLLKFLASRPGRVFSRNALLAQLWDYDYFGGERTVDVHIRRLRSKIEDQAHTFIETVRGVGYRFHPGKQM
ncbi:MAG TPA: response regulator transcription factor [Dehalococcoidia bacterium]|nr:response regulator transcription factor [Dehalococcoidia bacterium]